MKALKKPAWALKLYLARQYAKLYAKDLFVGVAGSVGKTTCVLACQAILSPKFTTLTTKPNTDPLVSICNTILRLTPKVKKVVLEMGFYLTLVQPQTMIVTKISYANCENLGGIDEIADEITKSIVQLPENGFAILNYDDPYCKKMAEQCKGQVIYFGTDPQNCTVWAGNIKIENFKTTFELNLGVERVKVNLPLLGAHQIYPAMAAAALGVINKIPLTKIKISLESLQALDHKMQVVVGPNNSIILDDTISCTPADVEGAIDTLLQVNGRRRILVLGGMRGLGKYSESLHRQIAQRIYKEKLDLCFFAAGETEVVASELKSLGFWDERVSCNLQSGQIVSKLLKTLGKGDVVLIKGVPSLRLDEVVKRIAKKEGR